MDEAEYSPSGGDEKEKDNDEDIESYDDEDNKLNRRFHHAKADAAVEALADPSPSTGHWTLHHQLWSFTTVLSSPKELCCFSTGTVE
jgi:hypothetical protein